MKEDNYKEFDMALNKSSRKYWAYPHCANLLSIQDNPHQVRKKENIFEEKDNYVLIKGVYWHKKNKVWTVAINYHKQRMYLGSFANYEDAVRVREKAEEKYFKEYRRDKKV